MAQPSRPKHSYADSAMNL